MSPRPIIFEPLAQQALTTYTAGDRAELAAELTRVASAEDPATALDPYMPGGVGPIPYHGVVVAGPMLAVVSFYSHGGIRVISISPHT